MTSIRRRLNVWLLGGLFGVLLAGGAAFHATVRSVLQTEFDSALLLKAQTLAGLVSWQDDGVEFDYADEYMPAFERRNHPEFFQVWLGPAAVDGEDIEQSANLEGAELPDRAGPLDAPIFWDLRLPGNLPGRAVGIRFRPENEDADVRSETYLRFQQSEVRLVMAKDRSELNATLATLGAILLGAGAAVLALTALVIGAAVRRGIEPLDALGASVSRIDAATLSQRLDVPSMPDELQPVCLRLNELLERLEESFRRERRFSANVAHELRTPIAELRSLAEISLKYPEDGEVARKVFQDALDIAVQMGRLTDALLHLVRCQSGQEPVRRQVVRISELVDEVWRPLDELAGGKGLSVANELARDRSIETDPALLRTIIQNVLANAVEYTPAGGRITLRDAANNGSLIIEAGNTVSGLTREDLPRLFEPFWRKDAARSDATHTGLGLALASECARVLNLRLTADLDPESTLRITLRQSV